jgi:hypothetical protein
MLLRLSSPGIPDIDHFLFNAENFLSFDEFHQTNSYISLAPENRATMGAPERPLPMDRLILIVVLARGAEERFGISERRQWLSTTGDTYRFKELPQFMILNVTSEPLTAWTHYSSAMAGNAPPHVYFLRTFELVQNSLRADFHT